jgi:hypothetical protein
VLDTRYRTAGADSMRFDWTNGVDIPVYSGSNHTEPRHRLGGTRGHPPSPTRRADAPTSPRP